MPTRWQFALAVLALLACNREPTQPTYSPTAECVEFCARENNELPAYTMENYACFALDEAGHGASMVDINTASWLDLAKIIDFTVSSSDRHLSEGESCEAVLCPLVDFAIDYRTTTAFEDLESLDQLLALPTEFGADGLTGIEVRTQPGFNPSDDTYWAGLKMLSYVDEPASIPTCCTTPDCTGTDYRCIEERLHDLPLTCEAL